MVMGGRLLREARGFKVGEIVEISCKPQEMYVSEVTSDRIFVDWPWLRRDSSSQNPWNGTIGFPRDPDSYGWNNIAWRVEPDGFLLAPGDVCIVGIPFSEVIVTDIVNYSPAADFGWLPRPEWALGLCCLEYADDDEAGFTIYLDSGEPVQIEKRE